MVKLNKSALVNILIVNYNCWEDTIECIESIFDGTYKNFQIFLVDNNSKDNSEENIIKYLKSRSIKGVKENIDYFLNYQYINGFQNFEFFFKNLNKNSKHDRTIENSKHNHPIIFLQTAKNLGFAGANNIVLKEIKNQNNYVWLLNPDMILDKTTLSNLVKHASSEKSNVIWGSIIKDYYGEKEIITFGGSRVNKHTASIEKFKTISDNKIGYIKGCSLFTHLSNFSLNGLLPEEYFLYWEESDWCFRAKLNGIKLKTCKEAVVYDKGGKSIGRGYTAEYYFSRNGLIFINKYFSFFNLITSTLFGLFKSAYWLFKFKFDRSKGVVHGIYDFYFKHNSPKKI